MKSPVIKTFLIGTVFGIGVTGLSLFAQRPGYFVNSLEALAEMGRVRRAKKEENDFLKKRLKAMGFSDKEIDENL